MGGFRSVVVVSCVVILGSRHASAFAPRQSTAAAIAAGSSSHEQITRLAFDQILLEAGIKKGRATNKSIDQIVSANAHVDDRQTVAVEHFDGESLPEGQQRLVRLLGQTEVASPPVMALGHGRLSAKPSIPSKTSTRTAIG
jgi:hypothetical protein